MKKIFIIVSIFVMMVMLTSCSDSYDLYILNSSKEYEQALNETVKVYEEETGIKIKIETVPIDSNYERYLVSELDSRNPPDIYSVNSLYGLEYLVNNEQIMDISTSKNEKLKILQDGVEPQYKLTLEGTEYLIPYGIDSVGLIVNKQMVSDLFVEDAELVLADMKKATYYEFEYFVKSLDKYIKTGNLTTITLNGNPYNFKPEKTGLAQSLNSVFATPDSAYIYVDLLLNIPLATTFKTSEEVFNATPMQINKLAQPLRAYTKTLDLITSSMSNKAGVVKKGDQGKTGTYNYRQSIETFASNKSLLLVQKSSSYNDICELNSSMKNNLDIVPFKIVLESSDISTQVSVSQINNSITVFSPNYFAINSNSSKKEIEKATDFIIWLNTTPEGQECLINYLGLVPFSLNSDNQTELNSLMISTQQYIDDNQTIVATSQGLPANLTDIIFAKLTGIMLMEEWTSDTYTQMSNFIIGQWINSID